MHDEMGMRRIAAYIRTLPEEVRRGFGVRAVEGDEISVSRRAASHSTTDDSLDSEERANEIYPGTAGNDAGQW
jgi:hypothetical protein